MINNRTIYYIIDLIVRLIYKSSSSSAMIIKGVIHRKNKKEDGNMKKYVVYFLQSYFVSYLQLGYGAKNEVATNTKKTKSQIWTLNMKWQKLISLHQPRLWPMQAINITSK